MGTYVGLRRKYGPVIPRLEAVQKRKTQNLTFSVRIKQTKMIFSLIGLVLLQSVEAKICWEGRASDTSVLQNVNIEGCRRRASYPHRQRFRCEGTEGPPCIVERGSTVHLDVAWQNPGVTNMTQSTVWVSGWGIEIPWVGMETEGCPYLDLGTGCRPSAQARQSRFYFPILIQEMYPAGKYDLKWKFYDRDSLGKETEVACFLFTIKII